MSTFHQQFMNFTPGEREAVAANAGLSLGYIQKHMYVSGGQPKFQFANAVRLDKFSCGDLPFIQHTEGEVDWRHVLRRLTAAKRGGLI